MSTLLDLGLCEAADQIRRRAISAEDLVRASVQAAETRGRALNAVVAVEAEEALVRARALDAVTASGAELGPLHGVPLAHKDMYYRAGKISACGSKVRAGFVAPETSPLISRLEQAGSVTIGRLHMAEFAMGPTGHNAHLGRCLNPWNPERISGGSSSGSGAVVAARIAFGALGSDTGGSVRLPAAMCGVVGLKPTQGLLPTDAMMGLSESLDCPGPLARSSRDVARLMDVMIGGGHEAGLAEPVAGLTLGIPRQFYWEDVEPVVAARLEEAKRVFAGLGIHIVPVDVPDHTVLADLADAVWTPEAAALHLPWLRTRADDYGPQLRARLAQGLAMSATAYVQARQLRSLALKSMVEGPLARCDALFVPAMRCGTPTGEETDLTGGDKMRAILAQISALTRPLSYLGLPGLVTPAGFDDNAMPVALQLIGRPREEGLLLRLAHTFEGATSWTRRKPGA